jgi:hypothetical protein
MFTLAIDAGKLMTRPKIKLLTENNVRQGFLEPDEIKGAHAPPGGSEIGDRVRLPHGPGG